MPALRDAKNKVNELKKKLLRWNHLYYAENKSEVEDEVYDACLRELIELEEAYPDLLTSDSPSQQVGGGLFASADKELQDEAAQLGIKLEKADELKKLHHQVPMISLANAFGEDEIRAWEERINRIIGEETYREYIFELKIDGLSFSVDYENGKLVRSATRGNGRVGEEVTNNVMTIKTLPKEIELKEPFSVRGEVFISKKDFQRINKAQEAKGGMLYANPRNTASGSLRQLDPNITAERHLDAFIYSAFDFNTLVPADGDFKDLTEDAFDMHKNFKTHHESLEFLEKLGFKTNKKENKLCKTIDEVIELYQNWQVEDVNGSRKKDTLGYAVDGAVVKVNQISLQKELGSTSKSPRWALALKFAAEEVETQIESISLDVGRTGAITPVANLTPVQIAGTTVKRASLHNFDQVERLGARVGDFVKVRKAGEIIPEVISVNEAKRKEKINSDLKDYHKEIKAPSKCPKCSSETEREDVALRCTNLSTCPAQVQRRIEHWCSKAAMNIDGVGPSLVEQLLENKLIENPLDLYSLTYDNFLDLERMAEKSAKNAVDSIEASKSRPFSRLLYALGIRHVGANVAELISNYFSDLESLRKECLENEGAELTKVDGLGPKIVESISKYFNDKSSKPIVDKLIKEGKSFLDIKSEKKKKVSDKFSGMTFVITGTLSKPRSHYESLIKENGGKASSSISKKTSFLLAGESAGSKLDKAESLEVKILSEDDFTALLT